VLSWAVLCGCFKRYWHTEQTHQVCGNMCAGKSVGDVRTRSAFVVFMQVVKFLFVCAHASRSAGGDLHPWKRSA